MHSFDAHCKELAKKSKSYAREFRLLRGIDFCSNDYLSLKNHRAIKQTLLRFFEDAEQWCSTGSRLVSGHSQNFECLEEQFARFAGRPSSLFFANGYQANLSAIASMMANCEVLSDEMNHASIIDGIHLSGAIKQIYQHCDANHVEELLRKPSRAPRAIITESIFSTNGAQCDLASLKFLADKYDALLLVDESHATGIYGSNGAGLLTTIDGCNDNIISTHSCGKALASFGAFIACSEAIADIIRNSSRPFICTTAPPPYVAAHVGTVLQLLQKEPSLRAELFSNIAYAHGILKTNSAILSIAIGQDERALFIRDALAEKNLDVAVFRYPSVKRNHAQLRITLHRGNTKDDIDTLQKELKGLL